MPTVLYYPNDPIAAGGPPARNIAPEKFPATGAKFSVQPTAKPGTYKPLTPEFDFWQTQTALIAGLRTWKAMDGKSFPKFFGNKTTLPVLTNAGDDLNAFYNRDSLQFFAHTFNGVTVHSAASVDVVTHEEGHSFLDSIRPDFWDVPFIEVGGFHEAFGDCVALLTALGDKPICDRVVATTADLSAKHFVEALAEQLGDAIRREYGPQSVEAGALRHALNTFRWTDPTKLPPDAPASQLAGEVHSFARVFVGAFYDVVRNIYNTGPKTSAGLQAAAARAGQLLLAAGRTVPAAPRIFEGVGKRMLQAEATLNKGKYATEIRTAFQAHGMALPAPAASLPVPLEAKRATRGGGAAELRKRMGVPRDADLQITPVDSAMHEDMAHVTAFRPLPLTGVMDGVQVQVPATARVTRRGRSITGVVGDVVPAAGDVDNEARAFVRALVQNGDVRVPETAARRLRAPSVPQARRRQSATHEVKMVKGEATLVRVGFS